MRTINIIHLLVGLLLLSCAKKTEEKLCEDVQLEEAIFYDEISYDIINSVLEIYFFDFDFIHIVQKTESTKDKGYIKRLLDQENIEYDWYLFQSYSWMNEDNGYYLSDNFKYGTVQLIHPSELDCLSFEQKDWGNYYKKYPESRGTLTFSLPGLIVEGNNAIIEYAWREHNNSGVGYLLFLVKENNNWIVTSRIITWEHE